MSTASVRTHARVNAAGVHARPSPSRLVAVELRKTLNTRAGFWLQAATVALAVIAVIVRLVAADTDDHTFAAILDVAIRPAAILLPVAGVVLITSEWSQRTGIITFALVPARSRVLGAKLIASLILALAMLAISVVVAAAGAFVASAHVEGTWADAAALIGQSAVYLTTGMVTGVAFGMVLLTSAPAIVALFALPITWTAVASLSFFTDSAPWLDTRLALDPLPTEVLDAAQWAHAGTALALWMLLPLLIGIWRITRREIAA
jgi:ABC-2 type transport system permease protein